MIFEKGKDWIDEIISVTKMYNNTKDSSTKLTPIRASLKENEYIYKIFKTREKIKPKFKLGVLSRTADKTNDFFPKGNTTNGRYKLYTFAEINNDIIANCQINDLPERY